MTGPDAVREIIKVHPALVEAFPHPEGYRSYKEELFDSASDFLVKRIMYLFEINETDVTLKFIPGEGWTAGAEFKTGLRGVLGEVDLDKANCHHSPGFALLATLWSCVVQGGYRPYYECPRSRAWRQRRLSRASP
ncbi:hypothetical protein D0962_01765 [Leptolyngbyaceae cyanobacterium CCMR0082]|uniref:Uncharacterized protein n=1 Tax=Adonisia turfae CCMR0082 TaxID=2304604 RepID=A0A6M0S0N9_9CYAN|nr:hypothetical protein [Adonisia turfae]NEZ61512.1 hypothetical protein [Adonisia turfae CCMR0082]